MAQKYLDQIDIHTGGIDLVFPHHENEIAQSEAATGKQFVRYWVHAQHLLVDGKKMSKSLGNFYTLKDIESKGYDPVAFRYLCLSSHYRSQLNFTFESLENAKNTLDNLNDFLRRVDDAIEGAEEGRNEELSALVEETKASFEEYMNDDLNTPQALSVVFEMIKVVNRVMDENNASKESLQDVYDFMMEFNDIFDILDMEEKELTDEEKELIEKREIYRKEKNFGEADSIRKELAERGIILEDSPTGVRWKKN
jgi:cysteinyl-tRNA synthetase